MGRHIIGRIVVFSVNFALWGSGIMLVVFGSIGVSNETAAINMLAGVSSGIDNVVELMNVIPYLQGVGIFMIVLGCFLFLLGGNGCHGIMRKSKKSTMMYFIWLLCAILVELALIIYGGVYPTTTTSSIEKDLTKSLNNSFANVEISLSTGGITYSGDKYSKSWQQLEFDSKCCGAKGKQDYAGPNAINGTWTYLYTYRSAAGVVTKNSSIPLTCCTVKSKVGVPTNIDQISNIDGCLDGATGPAENSYSKDGCGKKVNDLVYQFDLIAIIISSCLIGAEIVGVIFAARIWKDTDG